MGKDKLIQVSKFYGDHSHAHNALISVELMALSKNSET